MRRGGGGDDNQSGEAAAAAASLSRSLPRCPAPCFPCEREWPRGNDLNKPSSVVHPSPPPYSTAKREGVSPESEGRIAEGRKPNGHLRRERRATPNWIARSQTNANGLPVTEHRGKSK